MSDGGVALDPPREREMSDGVLCWIRREREMSDGLGMGRKRGLRGAAAVRGCYSEGLLLVSSISSLLDDSNSDHWFVDAFNATGIIPRGLSADSSSSDVNCLLGLDDAVAGADSKPPQFLDLPSGEAGKISSQEIHSVPDSPMMATTLSFGSTLFPSCLSNLPPICVHVVDGGR
ncbi:hypothetical protein MRB53_016202 [Persea americana]|uniref:Uncharacterized protein n=1 Tax=Persea americana TaxID=3435 RepID=A0ACC2M232_PERAE|nr:hypothetical protein MRB53_016202 [Persea americana]